MSKLLDKLRQIPSSPEAQKELEALFESIENSPDAQPDFTVEDLAREFRKNLRRAVGLR